MVVYLYVDIYIYKYMCDYLYDLYLRTSTYIYCYGLVYSEEMDMCVACAY